MPRTHSTFRVVALAGDLLIAAGSLYLAFLLRTRVSIPGTQTLLPAGSVRFTPFNILLVTAAQGISLSVFGLYGARERFRGPGDAFPGHWRAYPANWNSLPEEVLHERDTLRVAMDAIAKLPPAQRTVITMRDVDGLSSEEVRSALDISETNQRVLLHRARAKVRAALEERAAEFATGDGYEIPGLSINVVAC